MPGNYSPHPSRLSCLLLFVALVQRLLRARRTARLKLPRPLLRNQSYTMSFESPEQSEKQDSLTCAKVSRARSTRALLTAIFAVRTRCLPAARTFQAACDPDSWVTPLLLYSGAPWKQYQRNQSRALLHATTKIAMPTSRSDLRAAPRSCTTNPSCRCAGATCGRSDPRCLLAPSLHATWVRWVIGALYDGTIYMSKNVRGGST